MKRAILSAVAILCVGIFSASNADAAITVDGYLSDWGVTPGPYGASDWIPNPNQGIIYKVQDKNTWYLGPGYGGQQFDAEAIYGCSANGHIYGAIVTGFPAPGCTSGGANYHAGDIYFNLGTAQYGLKTTGPNAGMLYKNPLWNQSGWTGSVYQTTMQGGTGEEVGMTDFVYLHTYYGDGDSNDHWVMEMDIPESYFGSDWDNGGFVRWTESCGNNGIDLNLPAPEPASLAFLGLGLFGFLRLKRNNKQKERR